MTALGLQAELRSETVQSNMGKSSWLRLRSVSQANNFEETVLLISSRGLVEWYINAVNLVFPSLRRCSLLAKKKFGFKEPSCTKSSTSDQWNWHHLIYICNTDSHSFPLYKLC